MSSILIADSGATKAEWCLVSDGEKKTLLTTGLSPYFLTTDAIADLVRQELLPGLQNTAVDAVFFYGTGCANPDNAKSVKKALRSVFAKADVQVATDLMAAARAVCGKEKGIACILGTGSNSCYYNGKNHCQKQSGHRLCFGRRRQRRLSRQEGDSILFVRYV